MTYLNSLEMIKNIIFDFGDVFINLDKQATARMLIKSGFAGITPDLMELFMSYETGIVNTEFFISRAKKWVPKATNEQLLAAWNAILLDFPEYRLEFLEKLVRENRFRLFLLSNTNALHLDRVNEIMGTGQYQRFINCFEHCYFSHEVHLRKPDPEIFALVLEDRGLIPNQTLFIDDTEEHTISAESLGLRTWHLQVGKEDVIELNEKLPNV